MTTGQSAGNTDKFMGAARGALLTAALLGLSAAPALAETVRVESENVVLYGDVDANHAADFVRQMELYRRMIFALAGKDTNRPDAQKLTVHGFTSDRNLHAFAGRRDIGGVYTNGPAGPLFLSPVKSNRDKSAWANFVALHEYSHHVLHYIVEDDFPRWYDEGFANYLAALQITDELITVGVPAVPSTAGFDRRIGWLDPTVVLGATTRYPTHTGPGRIRYQKRQQFYIQSWLYVHYLQSHPELGEKLPDYLALLKRGTNPIKAFEDGFGITVADFHELAEAYWDADAFEVVSFKPQGNFLDVDVSVTPISKSDLALAELPAQIAFTNDNTRKVLSKRIKLAEQDHAGDPAIAGAKAALAMSKKDYSDAITAAGAALASEPDNILLHRILGESHFHRLQSGGANADLPKGELWVLPYNAEFETMVGHFERVLEEKPDDSLALRRMLTAHATSDAPMTQAARDAVAAFEDDYTDGETYFAIDLALVHFKDGRVEHACGYYDYANTTLKSRKMESWEKGHLNYATEKMGAACAGLKGSSADGG